jgi:hypothetical protein
MSCHICKRTGIRECDPQEAEVKCMVCGFCEKEALREQIKAEARDAADE